VAAQTFIDIMPVLNTIVATGDEKLVWQSLSGRLKNRFAKIANNAGMEGSVVVENVKRAGKGIGFNALTEEYVV